MQIKYDGPHPEVVVDEFDQGFVIQAGVPVEIPDDLAARLLEQDTWTAVDKPAQAAQATIDALATVPPVSTPDAVTGPENAPQGTSSTDDATKGDI